MDLRVVTCIRNLNGEQQSTSVALLEMLYKYSVVPCCCKVNTLASSLQTNCLSLIYVDDWQVFGIETSCPAVKSMFVRPLFPNSHYNLRCTFPCTFAVLGSISVAVKRSAQVLVRGNAALINWRAFGAQRTCFSSPTHARTPQLRVLMKLEKQPRAGATWRGGRLF